MSITFERGDGFGRSVIVSLLASSLKALFYECTWLWHKTARLDSQSSLIGIGARNFA